MGLFDYLFICFLITKTAACLYSNLRCQKMIHFCNLQKKPKKKTNALEVNKGIP